MKEIIAYMVGTLTCSGILLLAYSLLLERRVPFRICRAHLLASTAISMVIPLLDIPVWAGKTVYTAPAAAVGPITAEIAAGDASPAGYLPRAITLLYLTGVALSLMFMAYQLRAISRMRKAGTPVGTGRPHIIRAAGNISSFSFFGTIYIGRDTDGNELQSILMHECSHITHRHSAERMLMELMKTAMWWNPFAWVAQRRLIEVHEYEADADVLGRGYDVNDYIATILKSLFGYSPDIANGLGDSLTKKRFKMMTTPKSGRHTMLRTSAMIPVVAGLLCTFSFTSKATQYRVADTAATSGTGYAHTLPAAEPDSPSATLRLTVTDQNGAPLGDVKVVSAGKVYSTDADGKLTMPAANDTDLELSRDGYNPVSYRFSLTGDTRSDISVNVTMTSDKTDRKNTINMTMASPAEGQNAATPTTAGKSDDSDRTFLRVDKMPTFQGGSLDTFRTYVMRNVGYPAEALERGITGRVVASFTVDKTGRITDTEILQTPDRILSEQVTEVLSQSPAWTAGEQDGRPVKVKFTIPVEFNMPDLAVEPAAAVEVTERPDSVDKIVVVGFDTGKKEGKEAE